MSWLLGSRLLLAGLVVLVIGGAVFSAGNKYGSNARKWRQCQVETLRRNVAVDRLHRVEEARRLEAEASRAIAEAEFERRSASLQQCILDAATADALNLLRE